jgi:hypothetical protein
LKKFVSLKQLNFEKMPGQKRFSAKFDRCVSHVQASGKGQSASYAICQVSVNKKGSGIINSQKTRKK